MYRSIGYAAVVGLRVYPSAEKCRRRKHLPKTYRQNIAMRKILKKSVDQYRVLHQRSRKAKVMVTLENGVESVYAARRKAVGRNAAAGGKKPEELRSMKKVIQRMSISSCNRTAAEMKVWSSR